MIDPRSNLNHEQIIIAAIQTKNSAFLTKLFDLGLVLNYSDSKGWSALTLAVETNELNIVESVYNSGARFSNSKDEIWKAIANDSKDILDFLLSRCTIGNCVVIMIGPRYTKQLCKTTWRL